MLIRSDLNRETEMTFLLGVLAGTLILPLFILFVENLDTVDAFFGDKR